MRALRFLGESLDLYSSKEWGGRRGTRGRGTTGPAPYSCSTSVVVRGAPRRRAVHEVEERSRQHSSEALDSEEAPATIVGEDDTVPPSVGCRGRKCRRRRARPAASRLQSPT